MTVTSNGRLERLLAGLMVTVATVPGAGQGARTAVEELESLCEARSQKHPRSGDACYQLSLRLRDGVGVARNAARAEALRHVACGTYFRSYRACFTECMLDRTIEGWGSACGVLSLRPETISEIKRFLQAPEFEGRRRAVGKTRDLRFLRWVVAGTHEEIVTLPRRDELKEHAWKRIAQIALYDPDPGVRLSAVTDVTTSAALSQEELAAMAQADPDSRVRAQAGRMLGRIQTQLGTGTQHAEIATKHADPEVRREAVSRMGDQSALAKIAVSDPDAGVRAEAVQILEDQKLLARIAERDADDSVRQLATSGLKEQGALERLARRGRTGMIRQIAVEKVESQAVVARVAENDSESEVRLAAIRRLTDQAALAGVASNEREGEIRATAIGKITDTRLLVEIAVRETDAWGYQAAIDRIADENALREVLEKRWSDPGVIEHVARRTNDAATLLLILERTRDGLPLLVAATRLEDPRLAAEALATQKIGAVRKILVDKITDRGTLVKVAQTDPDAQVRAAAARRLTQIE